MGGTALDHLKAEFIDKMLPKWAATAFDAKQGQFMECLQLDGSPDQSQVVRTRTAARLIYVYAHASVLGVAPPGSLQMAERAFANLHQVAWRSGAKPGYIRAFNRATELSIDPVRDLYDNACVLLALSWLLTATGKSLYRQQIAATIGAIDQTLKNPYGGWAEDSLGTLPRRQNPHMHYFEASMALCENHRSASSMKREAEIFTLFRSRFFAGEVGPLFENFGPRWEVDDLYGSGRLEPGHMCEWVWLLGRHAALTDTKQDKLCDDLLNTALTIGRIRNSPFLMDQATVGGAPLAQTRRLWPQVEMLKALLTQSKSQGDDRYLHKAEALAAAMHKTYFHKAPEGCWHDMLDLNNTSIGKTIPASSLYHLWSAVACLLD
jgi:mannose/cellobiose epimerase-like protein (N-acyl-D-glucosamine 2-epimerase family)